MNSDVLDQLSARYRRRILNYHEPRYFTATNRTVYANHFLKKVTGFVLESMECTYKCAVIECFKEAILLQKKLPEVLDEIEKIRLDLKQKNWAVHEYGGALIEPFPISDLVEKEGPRPVIHFIVLCNAALTIVKMAGELLKAQKRGALAMKEERAIFERAKQGSVKQTKDAPVPVVGFKLEGKGVNMRIEKLYRELLAQRFIDSKTTPEQFAAVFNGSPVERPVIWSAGRTQLVYLLGAMVNYKLLLAPEGIAYGSWLYPRIIAGFHNSKGQPFTAKQLTQTLHDIQGKERPTAHRDYLESLVQRVAGLDWRDAVGEV